MAGKLTFAVEMQGTAEVMAQLASIVDLQKQISGGASQVSKSLSSIGSNVASEAVKMESGVDRMEKSMKKMRGYGMSDLPKLFAKSGFATPDVSTQMDAMFKKTGSPSKFEAMELLSKSGAWLSKKPGEDITAALAMQDFKTNSKLAETIRKMPEVMPGMKITGLESSSGVSPEVLRKQQEQWDKDEIASKLRVMQQWKTPVSGGVSDEVGNKEKSIKREADLAKLSDARYMSERRILKDNAAFAKDMTFAMQPLLNPGSVWGTMFASRQTLSALMTERGQGILGKVGLSGSVGGAALATGVFVGALTAAGLAVKGFIAALHWGIKAISEAIMEAKKIWSKSAATGLSIKFVTQRQTIADLLGVNETEIFRFGGALEWLKPKLGNVVNDLSKSVLPLTTLALEWEILMLKIKAFVAVIAVELKPAIEQMIKSFQHFGAVLKNTQIIQDATSALVKFFEVIGLLGSVLTLTFKSTGDAISLLVAKLNNALIELSSSKMGRALMFGLGGFTGLFLGDKKNQESLGITHMDTEAMAQAMAASFGKSWDEIKKQWRDIKNGAPSGPSPTDIPAPQPYMKQLPAAAWEKMGLVVGSIGGKEALDYARRTAKGIEKLVDHVTNGNQGGIPRGYNFGMNPNVGQP